MNEDLISSIFGNEIQISEQIWLEKLENSILNKPFQKIRNKIFKNAKVEPRHINEQEAKKLLKRKQSQALRMKEDAEKEEQKRKLQEESILVFLNKNSSEFE